MVCIRWVDELLQDLENEIGVYNVGTIDAKTLTDALEDVLLRAGYTCYYISSDCPPNWAKRSNVVCWHRAFIFHWIRHFYVVKGSTSLWGETN